MDARTSSDRKSIRRVVKTMGLALVLILGIGVPAGFAVMSWFGENARLVHEAEISAAAIEGHIYKTPEMWTFQTERLEGLLIPQYAAQHQLERAILIDGVVLVGTLEMSHPRGHGDGLPWPRASARVPVFLDRKPVAVVQVTASIRALLINAGLVWLGFAFLALVSYRSLAVAPLELLDRTIADLRETAKRATAADVAKSEFLATMSHEIRTPMNGVLGLSQLLAKTDLDQRQRSFLDAILSSGASLLNIINDILDFSKLDAGQVVFARQPFDLRTAVEEIATMMSMRADDEVLEVAVRFQPGLPETFCGDEGRIRQVVTNLAGNAVKFTRQGHVLIDVSGVVADGEGRLLIKVVDTGIGIAPDMIETIFDKFSQVDSSSTREFEGTGLGLAISRMLVDGMGGEIGVESTPGEGSTFWVSLTLPVHGEIAQRTVAPTPVRDARVLVVDDNPVNRAILVEQLEGWRFAVSAAASGPEALEMLRDAAGAGSRFDLVVLDFQMPGMDGAEVADVIRGDAPIADTPIALLSSVDQENFETRAGTLAYQEILLKPPRSGALFEAIVCVLSDHPLGGSGDGELEGASGGASDAASGGASDGASDLTPGQAPGETVTIGSNDRRWSGLHVLIVEDNPVNQLVAAEIMGDLGHEYSVVSNGREALDYLVLNRPDIVLMDVSMPVMNGLEATRAIRHIEAKKSKAEDNRPENNRSGEHGSGENGPGKNRSEKNAPRTNRSGFDDRLPIIGLTAHALQGDRERCFAVGMDAYLSKPVEPDVLGATIANLARSCSGNRAIGG